MYVSLKLLMYTEKKTDICGNWLKYVIEWLRNVRKVLSMWKMT